MKKEITRSPLFYVGDKYKLIGEIRSWFPPHIGRLIEPFVGGGSVMMNVCADSYLLNDIDSYVISLHRWLCLYAGRKETLLAELFNIIDTYGLSLSLRQDDVPVELKTAFPKTYFARFNKDAYSRMKQDFIDGGQTDMHLLYLLLIYGFNRMLRFNGRGFFNVPVGNVDFNHNVSAALSSYLDLMMNKQIVWKNEDFRTFLGSIDYTEDDLVYLDPPYLISASEYNKLWSEDEENQLLDLLDELNRKNVHFAISNVVHYRGRTNELFLRWSGQYQSHPIKSNYISFNDNSIKQFDEVLVTNY